MPISYLVEHPLPDPNKAKWTLLPADFAARFVAYARKNKTFEMHPDRERPGVFHMNGIDRRGRKLGATWSTQPAYLVDGKSIMVFTEGTEPKPERAP